jgi:MFS family permease
MVLLAGAASFFVGNSYQAQMPNFAHDLGHGDPGTAYSMLLAADAAGALTAGFLLESFGRLKTAPRTALYLATGWCLALAAFALTRNYALALACLFAAGFFELSFSSMAQTLVQLNAPDQSRGRVLGLYSMSAFGLRTFSGLTVGIVGSITSIHVSLACSGLAFVMIAIALSLRLKRTAA